MGTTVSRHPVVPIGYRVQRLGDGRYYPQLHDARGWSALLLEQVAPPTVASYETQDEAEEHCRRHARQNGGV